MLTGQRGRGAGQDARAGDIGAQYADNSGILQGNFEKAILQFVNQAKVAGFTHDDRDTVGVGGFEDIVDLVPGEDIHNGLVEADGAHHAGVVNFDNLDIIGAGDHLDAGRFAFVSAGDESAGVFGIEGIFDAQVDTGLFEDLGYRWMHGLHPDIGQLIGDIVVGITDGVGVLFADNTGIGRTEMVFLMDNCLIGLEVGGDFGEGDFGVAAVELAHDAFGALGVAGHKGDGF